MPKPFHPLAEIFPLIEPSEIRVAFAASIKRDGVRTKIVLLNGSILDGRNRYVVALEVGLSEADIPFREFGSEPGDGDDPLQFVLRENAHRRHLTDDQRRMVAARIANISSGRKTEEGVEQIAPPPAGVKPIAIPKAAAVLSSDVAGVKRARTVENRGVPELRGEVDAGRVSVAAASKVAVLPPAEQKKVVAAGPKAVVAKAAEMRIRAPSSRAPAEKQISILAERQHELAREATSLSSYSKAGSPEKVLRLAEVRAELARADEELAAARAAPIRDLRKPTVIVVDPTRQVTLVIGGMHWAARWIDPGRWVEGSGALTISGPATWPVKKPSKASATKKQRAPTVYVDLAPYSPGWWAVLLKEVSGRRAKLMIDFAHEGKIHQVKEADAPPDAETELMSQVDAGSDTFKAWNDDFQKRTHGKYQLPKPIEGSIYLPAVENIAA